MAAAQPDPGFAEWLRQTLGPPLKSLLAPLDAWLAGLSLTTAKCVVLGLFAVAGVWVLMLPRKFIYLGAPDEAAWRDLRWWALLVLLPYVAVYVFWG